MKYLSWDFILNAMDIFSRQFALTEIFQSYGEIAAIRLTAFLSQLSFLKNDCIFID